MRRRRIRRTSMKLLIVRDTVIWGGKHLNGINWAGCCRWMFIGGSEIFSWRLGPHSVLFCCWGRRRAIAAKPLEWMLSFQNRALVAFFFPEKEMFGILILLNPLLKSAMRMEVIFVNYKVLSNKSTAALKFAWHC